MGHSPSKRHKKNSPSPVDYATEPSPPCWPRLFLAYAHINKLIIIAKERTT